MESGQPSELNSTGTDEIGDIAISTDPSKQQKQTSSGPAKLLPLNDGHGN